MIDFIVYQWPFLLLIGLFLAGGVFMARWMGRDSKTKGYLGLMEEQVHLQAAQLAQNAETLDTLKRIATALENRNKP